jgi:formaldehyde-activating enzyme involved in methanogenesis
LGRSNFWVAKYILSSKYSEIIFSDNEEWYIIVEAVVKPNSFTENKSTIYNYNFKKKEPKNLEYRINSTLKTLVDTGTFETNVDTISILFIKKKQLDNMNDYREQFIFKYNEYKN